jgi:hypothetical protein
MVVFGAGFGVVTQILMVAIQNSVAPQEIGTATASANLFRALGGSVGVALYGAIFASGLRHWLALELPGQAAHGISPTGIQTTPARIHALAPVLQHGIAHAVANSLQVVFLVAAPIALVGFVVVTLLREQPLRGRGDDQRRGDDQPKPAEHTGDAPSQQKRLAA